MPITSTGIYEVVLVQTYQGQECLNVFHYLHSVGDDDKQSECATAFDADILPDIAVIQSDGVVYDDVIARNLTGNLADVTLTPTQANGDQAGLDMSCFIAIPFRYNRITKDTRNGSKRFVGLTEEDALTTGFEAAFVTLLQALAVQLAVNIVEAGNNFQPIVLTKPDDGAGNFTYNLLQNVQALNRTTSQNSRKPF